MRKPLRDLEQEIGADGSIDLLYWLIENSEELLTERFAAYFAADPFCRFDELERRIEDSGDQKHTKKLMLELSARLRRGQIVDNVFKRMERDGWDFDRKELLRRFEKLEVNPIPLWNKFCAEQLPSPVTLLREISDGELRVSYTVEK